MFKILKYIALHPLNKDRKIKSLFCFVHWQIKSRIIKGPHIYKWVNESKLSIENGDHSLTANLYYGFTEWKEMLFLLHSLDSEMKFIDVGGNLGSYSILAAKVIGSEVILFEPIPSTITRLNRQIELNQIGDKVKILEKAAGKSNKYTLFTSLRDTMNREVELSNHEEENIEVEMVRLDDYIDSDKQLIIKIDVEGNELNVLKGMTGLLEAENLVAMIIENNNPEAVFHTLCQDFNPIDYLPLSREYRIIEGPNLKESNTIYVRKSISENGFVSPRIALINHLLEMRKF
jgi:FkbM family methyltransferase